MSAAQETVETLVAEVLASARYRSVSPALVQALAQQELRKQRSPKEAVKAVKSKLHQAVGVFLDGKLASAGSLAALRAAGSPLAFRQQCRTLMALHASTRERLPMLETFYPAILSRLGPIHSILDLGCGLNPLAIPWMPLAEDCTYHAYDVHAGLTQFLKGALPLMGVEGEAHLVDLTREIPGRTADVALIMKCLPSLAQLDRAAGGRLLTGLRVKHIVVSFPVYSLGGRQKGMRAGYAAQFQQISAGQSWHVEELAFPTELVYVLTNGPA
ncbi:MAG TPA: 16S rRNA methyltransferase [Chloroflexota bacterium]|nr:16S rRNA methyltransferase [Chloroflexota bacterium]